MAKIEIVETPKSTEASARNLYRVPKKQWRRWSMKARRAFNHLYGLMMRSPSLFRHPKAIRENAQHWKTTAWNSAWLAADAVDEALPA